jgi:hypothetical protein
MVERHPHGNHHAASAKQGQRLAILDQDVDTHKLVQFTGPARLRLDGPMMMDRSATLALPRRAIYRLGTKTVEMPAA